RSLRCPRCRRNCRGCQWHGCRTGRHRAAGDRSHQPAGSRCRHSDVNLADGDVEPVLDRLKSRNIFVVIHTGGGLPPRLAARYPEMPVFQKPIPPSVLTRTLATAFSSSVA
ncbi:LOW QUALITY PROTEIN: response regulator receiver protein, partial [Brucella ceti M644/93/1]